MRERNPFEVLGVSPRAEREVIRAAYRALARMYHPDTQKGMGREASTARMTEINWAWEELQRDSAGWRARARVHVYTPSDPETRARGRAGDTTGYPRKEKQEVDEEAWWRDFTQQYRRPKGEPLGWREWIGSDVVCTQCGCVLKTWVYKCPECNQAGTWKRSKLHTIGHKLRLPYHVLLLGAAGIIALPFLLALLAILPILLIDAAGMGSGAVWDWRIEAQILLALGVALEVGVWAAWRNWRTLRDAARKYWES